MAEKQIKDVIVGTAGDRVGLQFKYADGTQETHLFPLDLAEQIAAQLGKTCAELKYIERQMPPKDRVTVTDHPTVRIIGHEEVKPNG